MVSRRSGKPCRNYAICGGTVCTAHGGKAPQVRNKAAVRYAVAQWTDDMPVADPGETLLRLMTVSLLRAEQHRAELDRLVTEHGWVHAFVGESYVVGDDGKTRKVGEFARQLAQWEARERHEAADLAVKAVAAGLAERQVRMLEQHVELVADALRAAVVAAGLNPEQQSEVIVGVSRHLRLAAS